jgi:hypothetical protein
MFLQAGLLISHLSLGRGEHFTQLFVGGSLEQPTTHPRFWSHPTITAPS